FGRVRRAPRIRAGGRPPPPELETLCPLRPSLYQGIRRRHEPELVPPRRRQRLDGLRQRRAEQAALRGLARRVARASGAQTARCCGPAPVRRLGRRPPAAALEIESA